MSMPFKIGLSALMCVGIAVWSIAAPRLVERIIYDDRPAVIVWNLTAITKVVEVGKPFVYSFNYSKRAECYPPKGSGEVEHRLWEDAPGQGFVRFRPIDNMISIVPPAINGSRVSTIKLPPDLAPGRYAVQYRSEFRCERASRLQEFISPLMEFDVIGPKAPVKMGAWTTN